jgi:nitroimidazol reductase NimA-like FMN-containing flavoprotein (pyridoxamine 5'-phosphate oxidase superfamily)
MDLSSINNQVLFRLLTGRTHGVELMRRTDKEITDRSAIESLLSSAPLLYLGIRDEPLPYVVPVNFAFEQGVIHLHSAPAGRKIALLKKHPEVSFTAVAEYGVHSGAKACDYGTDYRSVMGTGVAEIVTDPARKKRGLDILMRRYAEGPFEYDPAILNRTVVIEVRVQTLTAKRSPPERPE